jgi:hypothetical protein
MPPPGPPNTQSGFAGRRSGQALRGSYRRRGDEITLEPLRPRTFDKTSPVTAYWLTRCDGFEIAGSRGPAIVEGTVFDDDPLHPIALRVRRGQKSRRLIPIDSVEAVCPIERVLYVRRRASVASRAAVRTGAGVATAWQFGAPRARAASRATAVAARSRWPSVQRAAVGAAQAVCFAAVVLQALVVAGLVGGARLVLHGIRVVRRVAPHGARLVSAGWQASQLRVFPARVSALLDTRSRMRSSREEIANDATPVATDPVPLER